MSFPSAFLAAMKAAQAQFGHPRDWHTPTVAKWVREQLNWPRRSERPSWNETPEPEPVAKVLTFAPVVPDDERDAIQSEATEDGWR